MLIQRNNNDSSIAETTLPSLQLRMNAHTPTHTYSLISGILQKEVGTLSSAPLNHTCTRYNEHFQKLSIPLDCIRYLQLPGNAIMLGGCVYYIAGISYITLHLECNYCTVSLQMRRYLSTMPKVEINISCVRLAKCRWYQ